MSDNITAKAKKNAKAGQKIAKNMKPPQDGKPGKTIVTRSRKKRSTIKYNTPLVVNLPPVRSCDETASTGESQNNVSVMDDIDRGWCYPHCTLNMDDNMLRCCLCMVWHHIECTSEDGTTVGVWLCRHCRSLPNLVRSVIDQVAKLTNELTTLLTSNRELVSTNTKLVTSLRCRTKQCAKLKGELDKCRGTTNESNILIQGLPHAVLPSTTNSIPTETVTGAAQSVAVTGTGPDKLVSPTHDSPVSPVATPADPPRPGSTPIICAPTRTTVIGTSIARGVGHNLSSNDIDACIYVNPGCDLPQIRCRVSHMVANSPDVVVLQAGSVDVLTRDDTRIISQYTQTVTKIKKSTNAHIMLSTIPKRKNPIADRKAQRVNSHIRRLAMIDNRISVVDNFNIGPDDLREDGIHLNPTGTAKLGNNIKRCITSFRSSSTRPSRITFNRDFPAMPSANNSR